MNNDARQALWNSAMLVASLKPGQTITREELIYTLQRPLPKVLNDEFYPSDHEILGTFGFYVIRAGIDNSEDVVTYPEAARLGDSTEEAIRQAAARGRLNQKHVFRYGRVRVGVTLNSLAEYKGWDHDTFKAAAEQVGKWYKS